MNHLVLDGVIFGLQRYGGISNFWLRLIEAAAVDRPVGKLTLVSPSKIRAADLPDSDGIGSYDDRLPVAIARYLPVSVRRDADIFHTSYYRRPLGKVDRYITSVYDFTYERYFSGLPKFVHSQQKRSSIRAADMAVCISEATRDDLLNDLPEVDPARTCVVPLGVDRSRFYPDRRAPECAPYVIFVGQRAGYKRFDLAVDAVALLPALSLAIVGPPLEQKEKERLDRALAGRWTEHVSVSTDALRALYSDAYAFIFPSDYEGFGLPILEAMACGCPAVVANRSSFPEVAGDAALLAQEQTPEAYATLMARLEDSAFRGSLVAAGRARAGQFDWQHTFSKLWTYYR